MIPDLELPRPGSCPRARAYGVWMAKPVDASRLASLEPAMYLPDRLGVA